MDLKIKICCISSIDEASIAIQAGASAIGLVGRMPSGPGIISDPLIFEIAQYVPPDIDTFLLTSEITAKGILAHYERTKTKTIQIVDKPENGVYQIIKETYPKIKLVQVIHIIDESSIDEALEASQYVDFLLLDSGNPRQKIKQLGGTGRIHNWELSRRIREECNVPIYLAGGINSNNVAAAIKAVDPFGIDLCSGVRTNASLDRTKLSKFFTSLESNGE